MRPLIDCREASRLLSERRDREMGTAEHARLRLHLVFCDACRNVDAQMRFLGEAVRRLGRDDDPPR